MSNIVIVRNQPKEDELNFNDLLKMDPNGEVEVDKLFFNTQSLEVIENSNDKRILMLLKQYNECEFDKKKYRITMKIGDIITCFGGSMVKNSRQVFFKKYANIKYVGVPYPKDRKAICLMVPNKKSSYIDMKISEFQNHFRNIKFDGTIIIVQNTSDNIDAIKEAFAFSKTIVYLAPLYTRALPYVLNGFQEKVIYWRSKELPAKKISELDSFFQNQLGVKAEYDFSKVLQTVNSRLSINQNKQKIIFNK